MAWARPECGHDRHHVVLYCHGGGYTSGNLGYARVLASKLAKSTGYEVLSFEYRLAPEHPYPAALEDALAAWDYLMELGYGARDVVLAGDSAGGNLALVLTQALKEMCIRDSSHGGTRGFLHGIPAFVQNAGIFDFSLFRTPILQREKRKLRTS